MSDMAKVCILTDSTAQFSMPVFAGQEHVNVIPLRIRLDNQVFVDGKDLKTSNLPLSTKNYPGPQLLSPSPEEFRHTFSALGRRYNEIIAILLSSHLNPTVSFALEAAASVRGPANVHIIDSQSTAVGLGLLVQIAAEAAQEGATTTQISRLVRGLLPRIYTVFCVQSLTYLDHSGHLDPAQSIIGEMLGVTPFFILEHGRLVPIQKVRNSRHLVDILTEFISEFNHLQHIAIVQSVPPFDQDTRYIRDRLHGDFPNVSYSEHNLGPGLATILGPRSLGVVAMEACIDK